MISTQVASFGPQGRSGSIGSSRIHSFKFKSARVSLLKLPLQPQKVSEFDAFSAACACV